MLESHKNVYADFSGGTAKTRSMTMWKEMFAPNGQLHTASINKLCFVTDGSSFTPDHYNCLKKTIDFYEHLYEALRLPTAIRTRIYRENALTLIGSSA